MHVSSKHSQNPTRTLSSKTVVRLNVRARARCLVHAQLYAIERSDDCMQYVHAYLFSTHEHIIKTCSAPHQPNRRASSHLPLFMRTSHEAIAQLRRLKGYPARQRFTIAIVYPPTDKSRSSMTSACSRPGINPACTTSWHRRFALCM
jgi:hypothetical protein